MARTGTEQRRIAAVAAVVVASVASVASLDEAAPPVTSTGALAEQSLVLTEAGPAAVTVRVASAEAASALALTIHLDARWEGFADGGAADAGAPDQPIVRASLAGEAGADAGPGPDASTTLDRAITMAPGEGALILAADAPCAPVGAGCEADFTFTLDRIEPAPSGPVSVTWTATASITTDVATVVRITVAP
jgi:hypothetical protein